jgi:putative PIG3 family NAD(P)H quinone oxidoreductase
MIVNGQGADATLVPGEAPPPSLRPGEVLIAIEATAVNRADLLQRKGLYPPPPGASAILGLEGAGVVKALGPGVAGLAAGDRVMALLPGGGYAEEAVAPAGSVLPIPRKMSFEEAAAIPEAFITAYLNLFELGRAKSGEWVLVHGGSGGVGTAAIQLLRAEGCRVIVTCGSAARAERCRALGADVAVDYHLRSFGAAATEATGGAGVNLILDSIGAKYLEENLRSLGTGGRLVLIGVMGGRKGEIDLSTVLMRRLEILGSTLRSRSMEEKAGIIRRFRERFGARLESGAIRPVVDRVLPLERAQEAHDLVERGEIFGKIVLRVRT